MANLTSVPQLAKQKLDILFTSVFENRAYAWDWKSVTLSATLCDQLYIVDEHVRHEHLAMLSHTVEEALFWH